jgi:hypothetical protein
MENDLTALTASQHLIGNSASGSTSTTSAVSWAAILAGAVVAAAISLLLMVLTTGIDLASMHGAKSVTAITAIALIVTQWISAAGGGYITGRLRTKWVGTHTHEVFFRDTAHGFITWAVATLIVASALASAASSLVGGSVHTAGAVASGVASSPASSNVARVSITPSDLDMLFRLAASSEAKSAPAEGVRAQTERILARGLVTGEVPGAERAYVAQLVAAHTGVSEAEAQRRVDDTVAQAWTREHEARKAVEMTSIVTVLSMLVGAFVACVSAALGGRLRDLHPWKARPFEQWPESQSGTFWVK